MAKNRFYNLLFSAFILSLVGACSIPNLSKQSTHLSNIPEYGRLSDSTSVAGVSWRNYFKDRYLVDLIDTALKNNQELNVFQQEIEIAKNEVRVRKGEYLPSLGLAAETGYEKVGKYTWRGGVEENLDLKNEPEIVKSKSDFFFGPSATWEVDIWKKLRNSKNAATEKYMASIHGQQFLVTNLIAEIADSYYELVALDNLQLIVQNNIEIQNEALQTIKVQKEAAKVTQLAVYRFEAQLLKTENLLFDIQQRIVETENRINYLTGRFPLRIERNTAGFYETSFDSLYLGVSAQLMSNRPDVLQAERLLAAAKLEVKAARAEFYPSLGITAHSGFQSFNPKYLIRPDALVYNLAGELMAPLVNRNAIVAGYRTANARQQQALFEYEQTILTAYIDVVNHLSRLENFTKSYVMKQSEVDIRTRSVTTATTLFNAARADYGEVLFSQGEVLDSRMELVEIRLKQISSTVNLYRALGGGWR